MRTAKRLTGAALNVIPPKVLIGGTVRTLQKAVQTRVQGQLERLLAGLADAHNATYTFDYQEGYPVTYNHEPCCFHSRLYSTRVSWGEQSHIPSATDIRGRGF